MAIDRSPERGQASVQHALLTAAARLAPDSAEAWLALGDWLFALSQDPSKKAPEAGGSAPAAVSEAGGGSPEPTAAALLAGAAAQAYCAALRATGLSRSASGSPEDHTAVLLRLLAILVARPQPSAPESDSFDADSAGHDLEAMLSSFRMVCLLFFPNILCPYANISIGWVWCIVNAIHWDETKRVLSGDKAFRIK